MYTVDTGRKKMQNITNISNDTVIQLSIVVKLNGDGIIVKNIHRDYIYVHSMCAHTWQSKCVCIFVFRNIFK